MAPQRTSVVAFLAIGLVAVIVAVALFLFLAPKPTEQSPEPIAPQPQLTQEIALEALRPVLFTDCLPGGVAESYRSCSVELFKEIEGPGWKVWVTYDGLYDDSVRASRLEAHLVNSNGEWIVSDMSETNRCQEGRGHQDFSTELCV